MALTAQWTANASAAWSDTTRWYNGAVPDGVDDVANFTADLTGGRTVTIDGATRTVGTLLLADGGSGTPYGWAINANAGLSLRLSRTAGQPIITTNTSASTIAVPIISANGFTKAGSTQLVLSAANPELTGSIYVTGGSLALNGLGTLGVTTLLSAATSTVVYLGASSAQTYAGRVTGGGTVQKTGSYPFTLTNDTIDVKTLDVSGSSGLRFSTTGTQTVSSTLIGGGAVEKLGTGTARLTGGGSHTGGWTVSEGTLQVASAMSGYSSVVATVKAGATLKVTDAATFYRPVVAEPGSVVEFSGTSLSDISAANGAATRINTSSYTIRDYAKVTAANARVHTGTTTPISSTVTLLNNAELYAGATFEPVGPHSLAVYQVGAGTKFGTTGELTTLANGSGSYLYYLGTGGTIGAGTSPMGLAVYYGVAEFDGVTGTIQGIEHSSSSNATYIVRKSLTFSEGINNNAGRARVLVTDGATLTLGNASKASDWNTGAFVVGVRKAATLRISGMGANIGNVSLREGATLVVAGASLNTSANVVTLYDNTNYISNDVAGTVGTIASVIQDATAGGVAGLTVPASFGANYVGPPVVYVAAGDNGAIVTAQWDYATKLLTGYTLEFPGYGFTAVPSLELVGGGGTGAAAPVVTGLTSGGSYGFTKTGSGTVALTSTNTYTGTTTVRAGVLSIGNDTTSGDITSPEVVVEAGAALQLGRSNAVTHGFKISGAGGVRKQYGLGSTTTTTLTGQNSFTGDVDVFSGDLRVANNAALGTGTSAVRVRSSGTVSFTGGVTVSRPFAILGTGSNGNRGALFNKDGNNTITGALSLYDRVVWAAQDTYIGSEAGTLTLSNSDTVSDLDGAVPARNLGFVGNGNVEFSPKLTGPVTVTRPSGTGLVLLLNNSNDFTGGLTVNEGSVGYAGVGALGSGPISVAHGAALRFVGTGGATLSRTITLLGIGSTAKYVELQADGSAPLVRAGTFVFGSTTQYIAFGGESLARNTVTAALSNPPTTYVTHVAKRGGGNWAFANTANSYTGTTNVDAGTLLLRVDSWANGATVTSVSTVIVKPGAKIQPCTGAGTAPQLGRHTYKQLTFQNGARIRIGG